MSACPRGYNKAARLTNEVGERTTISYGLLEDTPSALMYKAARRGVAVVVECTEPI